MLELSLGSGIAIGTVSISAATVIISVIRNKPENGNGNGKFSQKLCDTKHKSLEGWIEGIDKKLDRLLDMHMKED